MSGVVKLTVYKWQENAVCYQVCGPQMIKEKWPWAAFPVRSPEGCGTKGQTGHVTLGDFHVHLLLFQVPKGNA